MTLLSRAQHTPLRSGFIETRIEGKLGPHTSLFMSWCAMTTGTHYEIHRGLRGKTIISFTVEPLDRSCWCGRLPVDFVGLHALLHRALRDA